MGYDKAMTQFRTSQALQSIEDAQRRAARLLLDPTPDERKASQMCRLCYYSSGMSVPGEYVCGVCAKQVGSSGRSRSTCNACADAHDLCKVCGADRELREGRRR